MAVPPPQINFYEPTIYEPCGCSEIAPNSACCVEGNCCCMPKRKDYSAVNKKVGDLKEGDELIAFGKVLALSATHVMDRRRYRAISALKDDRHQVIVMEENAEVAVQPTGILPGQSWTSGKVLRVEKPDLSSPEDRESLVWLSIQTTGGAFAGIYVKRADLREALLQVNLPEPS